MRNENKGTRVQVVPHQGRTAITVDGQAIPGMSYFTYMLHGGNLRRDVLQEMVDSGLRIFFVLWQTWRPRFHAMPWSEDGTLDFTPLDEWMAALAGMAEDVWFIPRIYLDTPSWWAERNPEELVKFADEALCADQVDDGAKVAKASMASRRWRDDAGQVLRRIVEHVETGPHADRVLGYMINSGGTEEWVYWGAQQGRMPDYSPAAREAFHGWLATHYKSPEALASAWNDQEIHAFADAAVPSEAVRRRCEPDGARDPARDRQAIDYDLFLSDLCADNLLEWCRVVKDATRGRRLTGAFYGYLLWQTGYAAAAANNAHLALRRLLDAPEFDFVTGIVSYDNRGSGEPGSFMLPAESVQAAGKLLFNEIDIRTHLVPGRPSRAEIDPGFRNAFAYDAEESVSIYRREFSHNLIHGAAWWNFDMGGGWYSCPEILAEFSRQARIAQSALQWNMESVAEMAAFISPASPAYQRPFTMQEVMEDSAWLDLQCDRATTELYRTGVPVDWWMTDDLARPEMMRYKLIYIFHAMYLSARERAALERLKGGGRTLVFCGAAGMIDESGIGAECASEVTGIRMRLDPCRRPLTVDAVDCDHPVMRECQSAVTLGTGALSAPSLEVDDPDSRTLGVWRATGRPAWAVKEFGDWRSMVCPVPVNHALVMRGIARLAGCHVWIDPGRVLYVNRSLLAVHIADSHAPMRVHLPRPMDVTDLIAGREVARQARHFLIQEGMRSRTTFLYRLT